MRTRKKRQSRWFGRGSGIARKCGLFLFETGDRDDPQWEAKSLTTGKTVVIYYPASGRYICGDEKGNEWAWARVFAMGRDFERRVERH